MAYSMDGVFISDKEERIIKKTIMDYLSEKKLTVNSARFILEEIINDLGKTPL